MYGLVQIPLGRAGKFGRLDVETDKFNEIVQKHVYTYGLRQILNDAMADKKDEDGNIVSINVLVAMAQKRLDTLYSGELRSRRSEIEPLDPIEQEFWVLARHELNAALKVLLPTVPKGTKDRVLFLVNQNRRKADFESFADVGEMMDFFWDSKLPKWAKIRETAEENVKNRSANLDEIGL